MGIKRAFTKDGGSFIRVRDEEGKIDIHAVGASIIRIAIAIGAIYLASLLGVELPVL